MAIVGVLGRTVRDLARFSRSDVQTVLGRAEGVFAPPALMQNHMYFSAMPAAEDIHEQGQKRPHPKCIMAIGTKSDPNRNYGYMTGKLLDEKRIYMKCTGIGAVYNAIKAITLARTRIKMHNLLGGDDICMRAAFQPDVITDRVSKFTIAVDRVRSEPLESPDESAIIRGGTKLRVKEVGFSMAKLLEVGRIPHAKVMGPVPAAVLVGGYASARKKLIASGEHDLICYPEYISEDVDVWVENPEGEGKLKTKESRKILDLTFKKVPFDPEKDVDKTIGAGEKGKTEGSSSVARSVGAEAELEESSSSGSDEDYVSDVDDDKSQS